MVLLMKTRSEKKFRIIICESTNIVNWLLLKLPVLPDSNDLTEAT